MLTICIQSTEEIWWNLGEALSTAARFIGWQSYTWLYTSVNICFCWSSHDVLFSEVVVHAYLLSFTTFVVKWEAHDLSVVVAKLMHRKMFGLCISYVHIIIIVVNEHNFNTAICYTLR